MVDELFSVVVVGVTGDGKSTTCNTLCGRAAFDTSGGLSSETADCAHADYLCLDGGEVREMRVVDTIGLHDTSLPAAEVMKRFSLFSDLVPCGIDVFLFVVRYGRWKPEHEAAMDAFAANCGDSALANTILVFTNCTLEPAALAENIEAHAPASLRRLLPRLAGPPVGVDHMADAGSARLRIHSAIETAATAGGGMKRYSNEALAEARLRYDAKREEERQQFAAAVADWRKGSGPVVIEREQPTSETA